jgi:hypothetical protein
MTAAKKPPRSGLTRLKRGIYARGLSALDKRSATFRALKQWEAELIADCGGSEFLSVQRRTLIEKASIAKLLLDSVDSYVLELTSLVNRRSRRLLPILAERQRLAASLERSLLTLGLNRTAKPVRSLQEHIKARSLELATPTPEIDAEGQS